MMIACETGDVRRLKALFREHNIHPGDDPVWLPDASTGAPYTNTLFACAIQHGQAAVVRYLLTIYVKAQLAHSGVVAACVERLDVKMLQLVYDHSPEIVNYESGSRTDSFLGDACLAGPQAAPLIHFLLDHGADPDVPHMFGGALRDAVERKQPLDVLKRLIPHISLLFWGASAAIKQGQLDATHLIITDGYMRRKFDSCDKHLLLKEARASSNREISTMVAELVEQWEAHSAVLERARINTSQNEKAQTTDTQLVRECDSDSTGSGHYKTILTTTCEARRWWQFWK